MLYANQELCKKWNNNIPLTELGFPLIFHTDSQDLESFFDAFPFLPRQEITGILASQNDGDYIEIYVTESSNPYKVNLAVYHPLEYYK